MIQGYNLKRRPGATTAAAAMGSAPGANMVGALRTSDRKVSRSPNGSTLSEFGPALWIFFLFFLFPLFNLVQFACGVATVMLIANESAQAAASAPDFNTGLANARKSAANLAASGLGQFAHLTPVSKYGVSLYIIQTTVAPPQQQTVTGPDQQMTTIVDPNKNIYEVQATCDYNVGPMLPMKNMPMLSSIPLIGKPFPLSFHSQKSAEFPGGLSTAGGVP